MNQITDHHMKKYGFSSVLAVSLGCALATFLSQAITDHQWARAWERVWYQSTAICTYWAVWRIHDWRATRRAARCSCGSYPLPCPVHGGLDLQPGGPVMVKETDA